MASPMLPKPDAPPLPELRKPEDGALVELPKPGRRIEMEDRDGDRADSAVETDGE